MFDAIDGMQLEYVLSGIIWAIAIGFAAGNYACSLVHRLPRGHLLLDKTPYCGSCGTLLKVKDLFPVISALMLKHRCRYCGMKFPVSHTWTELLVGLLFVLVFLKYNFTESFLLVASTGVFLITLAAIHANEGMLMNRILVCAMVFGIIFRTLQDGTIYEFFEGGLLCFILGMAIKFREVKRIGHIYSLPDLAKLLTVGGICVGAGNVPVFLLLFALFYAVSRLFRKMPITVPFGFAVMLVMMYSDLLEAILRSLI